jgi:glutathione S-transferase
MSDVAVIHGVPGSPYVRSALLGFEERHIPYRLEALPIGGSKSEEHLRRQPFGRVPALEHGDFWLYETQAILRYANQLGSGPTLVPVDAKAAGRMNQIVGIVDWYVFPSITVGITAERIMAQIFWGRPTDETNIARALPVARTCVRELQRLKGSAEFVAGDSLSIADLMLAPQLEFFRATAEGSELLKGTSLDSWLTRMSLRASMQATQVERLRQTA